MGVQTTMAHILKQQSWKPLAFHKKRLQYHHCNADCNNIISTNEQINLQTCKAKLEGRKHCIKNTLDTT